jgi:hypothetical protein
MDVSAVIDENAVLACGRIYAPGGRKREEKRLTGASFLFIKSILRKATPIKQGDPKGGQP